MKRALAIGGVVALAACGAGGDLGDGTGDATDGADAGTCNVNLDFDPPMPLLGTHPQLRAIADVSEAGVQDYTWTVIHDGQVVAFEPAQAGSLSQIRFDIPEAGIYAVRVTVAGCDTEDANIEVVDPGGTFVDLRLRVIPPPSLAVPPIDRIQRIYGLGDSLVTAYLDRGIGVSTTVVAGATPIPAYVRFAPTAMPDAAVEAFADADGAVSAQLLPQPHAVLIVPTAQTHAPVRIASWNPISASPLVIDTGTAISGVVRGPGGAGLAGATVQLMIDGVPSTYATTSATGSFTVRASTLAGLVTVTVTPPAATGLPRLTASSATFQLTAPITIAYAALTMRDVGGTTVTRGAPLPNARVTLVGTIAAAGSVSAGAAPAASAEGMVRIPLVASAAGALPTALAPAARIAAVVAISADDAAVSALDLTASVPATIAAPAPVPFSTLVTAGAAPAPRVELEAVPIGELAMASVQPRRFVAGANGVTTGALASGGRYQLRFRDPAARGATRVVDSEADAVAATYALLPANRIVGTIVVAGSDLQVDRAIVQLLCEDCAGLDRGRPLAETTSVNGEFTVAVPDPDAE